MTQDLISNQVQFNQSGKFIHLLGLEGVPKHQLINILDKAQQLITPNGNLKKIKLLDDMLMANLFFEPSTRTRNTFEIAAIRSGVSLINVDLDNSALKKNEKLLDTMHTLRAMQINIFVIRHKQNGLAHHVAKNLTGVSILNAGDGTNAHPTQALLDMLSIRQHKKTFSGLSVAIVGDVIHSRVAHSNVQALKILGTTDIRLIAPHGLQHESISCSSVCCFDNIEEGIANCDVIIVLRIQKERMIEVDIPNEQEYFNNFGLTVERLSFAKPDVIVLHPGPINRGVEIDSKVADSSQSVILQQVTNGIAVRMAVIDILAGNITNE